MALRGGEEVDLTENLFAFTEALGEVCGQICHTFSSWITVCIETEKKQEMIEAQEDFERAVRNALEEISKSQNITKEELSRVRSENENLNSWYTLVKDMQVDLDCKGETNKKHVCSELRKTLEYRLEGLKAHRIRSVINSFSNLRNLAVAFKDRVTN